MNASLFASKFPYTLPQLEKALRLEQDLSFDVCLQLIKPEDTFAIIAIYDLHKEVMVLKPYASCVLNYIECCSVDKSNLKFFNCFCNQLISDNKVRRDICPTIKDEINESNATISLKHILIDFVTLVNEPSGYVAEDTLKHFDKLYNIAMPQAKSLESLVYQSITTNRKVTQLC
jgi:hypothetical protein